MSSPIDRPFSFYQSLRVGSCALHGRWSVYVEFPHCNEGPLDECPQCANAIPSRAIDEALDDGFAEGHSVALAEMTEDKEPD